ncbi:hypothetical protein VWH97_06775 [Escherichia coli O157]|nr:hypothetical protein [Escherichia coli O157]
MIDNAIIQSVNLFLSSDALSISNTIWKEKYKWLPENFSFDMLETDSYSENNNNIHGFVRTGKNGYTKMYFHSCDVCKQDSSLHGLGIFASVRSNLEKGIVACDCSITSKLTKYQYIAKIYKKCLELGYEFIGFNEDWESTQPKGLIHLKLSCNIHGLWNTTTIDNLLFHSKGCKECGRRKISQARTIGDEFHINEFFKTGKFSKGSKFWRSDRLNTYGYKNYWFYECSVCHMVVESQIGNLKDGKVPCLCNGNIQQQCYINLVLDNNIPIALKYGIANNFTTREKSQNKHSIYDIVNSGVWEFETVSLCKSAEAECKRIFSPVLEAREMKDGYTETTSPLDIDKIIEIYENWGGVRIK